MMNSMTGYGRAVCNLHGRTITAEIKSVNHRYFDCTVKTTRLYGYLEDPAKKLLQDSVTRGKLDVYIGVDDSQSDDVEVVFNEHVFEAYIDAMRSMAQKHSMPDGLTALSVSRLPEVFTIEKRDADTAELIADAMETLAAALAEFTAMRAREGEKLFADLDARRVAIAAMLEGVALRAPQVAADYREKITARIREILDGVQPDESRLLTEAALFADRVAIDEEIVRLSSHLAQLADMLRADIPIGRKLDFLVQEMNREANTIGSKANDLQITKTVVDIKAEIEKIREQVQNVE